MMVKKVFRPKFELKNIAYLINFRYHTYYTINYIIVISSRISLLTFSQTLLPKHYISSGLKIVLCVLNIKKKLPFRTNLVFCHEHTHKQEKNL